MLSTSVTFARRDRRSGGDAPRDQHLGVVPWPEVPPEALEKVRPHPYSA